ncbi:cell division protein ZapA [bacterium]|nr:cell division protein ZapA [bacterium]
MSEPKEFIHFTIFGQEFRIRSGTDTEDRILRVARMVERRGKEHRARGANSDVRAALMAAYELGFELDELNEALSDARSQHQTIDSTREAMDRLLSRLDKELTDEDDGPGGRARKKKNTSQLDLTEPEN